MQMGLLSSDQESVLATLQADSGHVYVHEVEKAGFFLNSILCISLSWLLVTLSIAGFLYASCSSLLPGLPWLTVLLAS